MNNTTASFITAIGADALGENTTGEDNTAIGADALAQNTTGHSNTAIGEQTLYSNITGRDNTAIGIGSLFSNTTGNENTAIGFDALVNNITGHDNTANGLQALQSNTTGTYNTANGVNALYSNTTGNDNTASGFDALNNSTTGGGNIALGFGAGDNLTTGDNDIYIGNEGVADESNTIRIGVEGTQTATFIAGIANATVTGSAVFIDTTNGQLGLLSSSERFKDGIEPMGNVSEALLSLRPVTFRYKKNIDPKGAPQFGLVAEDVEKVNPDLVVRDAEGKVFTVRYEAVNAMLLNEFLKEHKKVEKQEATITRLTNDFQTVSTQQRNEIQLLSAQLKGQAAQIQKVSAELEASKPAPQVVNNP